MNLVDTSGWLEYFFGGPNAEYFKKAIEQTAALVVPTICLYEVFKKINLVGDEASALQGIAQMKQGKILPVDESIALKAALISIRHKLPMADSMIYSAAISCNAILWTQDEHFKGLPNVNYKEAESLEK